MDGLTLLFASLFAFCIYRREKQHSKTKDENQSLKSENLELKSKLGKI